MIRRPPRSTLDRSSAASDVYKRQDQVGGGVYDGRAEFKDGIVVALTAAPEVGGELGLSLIHISEPTRPY